MKRAFLAMLWKARLKKRYLEFVRIADQFDCGHTLACYVSYRVSDARDRVNEAIDKCSEFDPLCNLRRME